MLQYKVAVQAQLEELHRKQQSEMEISDESSNSTILRASTQSPEISSLKKKMAYYIDQGNYKEAEQIKFELDQLEQENTQRKLKNENSFNEKRQRKMQIKHIKELRALEMKINANWTKLWHQRASELENIKKQYINAKQDIDSKYRCMWLKLPNSQKRPYTGIRRNLDYSF